MMMPTSDELREVAEALDDLSGIVLAILNSDIKILLGNKPLDEESRNVLRDWVSGTEIQDDLRGWADELDLFQELERDE
jgi:hypothetical protein